MSHFRQDSRDAEIEILNKDKHGSPCRYRSLDFESRVYAAAANLDDEDQRDRHGITFAGRPLAIELDKSREPEHAGAQAKSRK